MSSSCSHAESNAAMTSSSGSVESQTSDPTVNFGEQEYETQFFGFTPKSFVGGLYNAVFDYMLDYIEPTINTVKTQCQLDISEEQMQQSLARIHASIDPDINKTFDKFEKYLMANIFHVPSHVVLPEDGIHSLKTASNEDIAKVEQEIKELQELIAAKKYVNECLREELAESNSVFSELDIIQQNQKMVLKTIDAVGNNKGVVNFKDGLKSAAEQLAALQNELNGRSEGEPPEKKPRIEDEMM